MTRQLESPVYGDTTLEVVILPDGSYYGEIPVMLGIKSYFGLKTVTKTKGEKH